MSVKVRFVFPAREAAMFTVKAVPRRDDVVRMHGREYEVERVVHDLDGNITVECRCVAADVVLAAQDGRANARLDDSDGDT